MGSSLRTVKGLHWLMAFGIIMLFSIFVGGSGKAFAEQCKINSGDPHDFAGLQIGVSSVDSNGTPQSPDYSNVTIRVDTHYPSYSNADGSFNSNGTGFYNMYNSNNSGGRVSGASFHPSGGQGACIGNNNGIVLSHDGTGDVNGNKWMLDCDYSYRVEFGGPRANPSSQYQEFAVYPTSNAPPNGLRGEGSWTVSVSDPGNVVGEDTGTAGGAINNGNPQIVAPANGNTARITFTYHEPPPQPPQPPEGNPTNGNLTCTDESFTSGDVVVGSRSYPIQAVVTLSGGTPYNSTRLGQVTNRNIAIGGGGNTTYISNYTPTSQSVTMGLIEYYNQNGTNHYVNGSGPGSPITYTVTNCYSAVCDMSIDTGLPGNYMVPGRPFTVYATISNNSVPYDSTNASLQLPGSDADGGLQFANNGGTSGFNYGFPGGIGSNGVVNISFTATASAGGSIVGKMAYGGHFMGAGCSVPLNPYPPPQVTADGVNCAATVYGWAYDPIIPSASIEVDVYVDGPAGTGAPLGPGSGAPLGSGQYVANGSRPDVNAAGIPGDHGYSIPITSPYQDGQNHTFYVYAIDPNGIENGGPATVAMTGCEGFHITPGSNGAHLMPSVEAPTSFGNTGNDTSVTVTYGPSGNSYYGSSSSSYPSFPGVPASAPYTYTKNGAPVGSGSIPSQNGKGRFIDTSYNPAALGIPLGSYQAGDKYCLIVGVSPSDGFIQNDGTVLGTPTTTPNPDTASGCDTVQNRPYFKVYGGSILSGSSDTGGTCTPGTNGELASWNNDSGEYPSYDFGASTQFSALALGDIVGFASAQRPSDPSRSPSFLSFANTGLPAGKSITAPGPIPDPSSNVTNYDPHLGGDFGATPCVSTPTAPTTGTHALSTPTDIGTLGPGAYTYTGNLTLTNPGAAKINGNISIFVKGNIYIKDSITYDTSGWSINNVPLLELVAAGGTHNNIYIAPGVTELDGIYEAQNEAPNSFTGNPSPDGRIYTCGNSDFTPMAAVNLFAGCNNQLTVYGSFLADKVNLMRTYGSLRDEAPVITASYTPPPKVTPLTRVPVSLIQYSCAVGNTGNTYQHSHWYAAAGPGAVQPPVATADPNDACPNPTFDSNDGYVFPPGDSIFTSTFLNASYNVLCEYENHISGGGGDHLMAQFPWTPGFSCGAAFPGYAGANPIIVGYVAPAGTRPLYQYYDSSSYGSTGFHYYTINDSGPKVDNVSEEFDGAIASVYTSAASGTVSTSISTPQPSVPTSVKAPTSPIACSNPGIRSSLIHDTCAAEVFEFSPELYLTAPPNNHPNGGAPTFNSITGLPPVL